MSIGSLLTGIWLIVDIKVLGLLAFIAGIVWLIEGSGKAPWRV